VRFLEGGGRARVLGRPATRGGRAWPAGSWFLPTAGNDTLQARVTAAGLGASAVPVQGGISEEGIDLGSDHVAPVRLPRVAVLAGDGVSPTSFGAYWFYLEQEIGLTFDALLVGDLERADLGRYDVVVVPDGSSRLLSESQRNALGGWVERGGRLVAVGGGAAAVATLAEIELREDLTPPEEDRARLLRGREERERDDWREQVPGSIIPARLDPAHPLAWGAGAAGDPRRLFVLHVGARIFEPSAEAETVVHFPAEARNVSGVISDANLRRLEEGSWLVTRSRGRGSIFLFAGDPLFRLFWRSTHPLFFNALMLHP
jgi:hypothetical protein